MPRISEIADPADTAAGRTVREVAPLFMRIVVEETEKTATAPKAAKPAKVEKPVAKAAPELPGVITIEDFAKLQLRTAKILEAERIEGADKLLKLQIDVGGEKRQLVAGIAKHYTPEQAVGKTIIIIANLKPAKLRGVESQGMLLAAFSGDELKLLTTDGELPSGSAIR